MTYWEELKCLGDKKVVIEEGIKEIPAHALEKLKAEEIVLPNSLEIIGEDAFSEAKIKKVTIPASVNKIESCAFYKCDNLKQVSFKSKALKDIGSDAFYGCVSLKKVCIPYVERIGYNAFERCTKLESVEIQSGLISLGEETFKNCHKLKNVTLCDGITEIKNSCFEETDIKSFIIPNTVSVIGNNAFTASSLKTIVIPNGVTTIGDEAFSVSEIESVVFAKTVKTLGKDLFTYCDKLQKIVFQGNPEHIHEPNRGLPRLKELEMPIEALLTLFVSGWIKQTVDEDWWLGKSSGCVKIGDITIQGSILNNFPCPYDEDLFDELLSCLKLEEFSTALHMIRENNRSYQQVIVKALMSYLNLVNGEEV